MKDNFFVKAWKGEEKFWKVFLLGIIIMFLLLYLKLQWQALMPFILITVIYPLVLIPMTRCRKNIDLLKNDPWFLYIINLVLVVLWVWCILIIAWSVIVMLISSSSCTITNNGRMLNSEFCIRLF